MKALALLLLKRKRKVKKSTHLCTIKNMGSSIKKIVTLLLGQIGIFSLMVSDPDKLNEIFVMLSKPLMLAGGKFFIPTDKPQSEQNLPQEGFYVADEKFSMTSFQTCSISKDTSHLYHLAKCCFRGYFLALPV